MQTAINYDEGDEILSLLIKAMDGYCTFIVTALKLSKVYVDLYSASS